MIKVITQEVKCHKCLYEFGGNGFVTILDFIEPNIDEKLNNRKITFQNCPRCKKIIFSENPILFNDTINEFAILYNPLPSHRKNSKASLSSINYFANALEINKYDEFIRQISLYIESKIELTTAELKVSLNTNRTKTNSFSTEVNFILKKYKLPNNGCCPFCTKAYQNIEMIPICHDCNKLTNIPIEYIIVSLLVFDIFCSIGNKLTSKINKQISEIIGEIEFTYIKERKVNESKYKELMNLLKSAIAIGSQPNPDFFVIYRNNFKYYNQNNDVLKEVEKYWDATKENYSLLLTSIILLENFNKNSTSFFNRLFKKN